jgi:predicted metal-dependent phosphoesterase TrpH
MFDLHLHTCCSDGSDSPNEVLQKAERLGLSVISITDHDNCDAYESLDMGLFSGKIVTGIEMQAYFKGLSIELLGYGYNITQMQSLIKGLHLPFEVINKAELQRLYARCRALGVKFASDTIKHFSSSGYFYATEYLHHEMRNDIKNKVLVPDEESWEQGSVFFRRHVSNPQSPFYIDESDLIPSVGRVADTIHQCGGKVFIPHIYQYDAKADKLLRELVSQYSIDGVECFYPSFTDAQTGFLLDFCQKNRLLVSGGSDYHGTNRSNTIGVLSCGGSCFHANASAFA